VPDENYSKIIHLWLQATSTEGDDTVTSSTDSGLEALTGCITGLAIWICNPWLSGDAFYGTAFRLPLCSCLSA
jgi:hypothetical protein